ncbi:MAG: class I SAM-dependent methyltransferase [Methyloligella sp. ZOD6]
MSIAEIQKDAAAPDYGRDDKASVDEAEVVAWLCRDKKGGSHVMLDVGAHFGTSAAYFRKLGWKIYCFEPDSSNRAMLTQKFGSCSNIVIDPRAVSNEPATGVSLFCSDESTGISSLHAFRNTHREAGRVDVTTVAEIVEARDIDRIDFLKIDVEGFDFDVLKGVPWDRVKPDVILAEFEDAKTKPRGHTYENICAYLKEQGYTVYLSEWHPVIRYGVPHDWRRIVKWPENSVPDDAWGNILAFKNDPGIERLWPAFDRCLKSPDKREISLKSAVTRGKALAHTISTTPPRELVRKIHRRSTDWTGSSGFLFRWSGRFIYWLMRMARQHPLQFILPIVMSVALLYVAHLPSMEDYSELFLFSAIIILTVFGSLLLLGFVGARTTKQINDLRSELTRTKRELGVAQENIAEMSEVLAVHADGLATLERLGGYFESGSAVRFGRLLTRENQSSLRGIWSERLGLELKPTMIDYCARRVRTMESILRGRLATAVEDMILRTMVPMSVKQPTVSILEIGTLFGVGAAIMYELLRPRFDSVSITLLDPLDGYYGKDVPDVLTGQPISEEILRENLDRAGVESSDVTLIKNFSTEDHAIKMASARQYDVLIIDGDHTYDGVKFDFEHYAPMVKIGGYVIFDDYGSQDWPDVTEYVDKEVADLAWLELVGHQWRTSVFRVVGKAPAKS